MVEIKTPAVNLNWTAPDFELIGTDGNIHNLNELVGDTGLVVMFICNHCPYVKAILDKIIRDAQDLEEYGINCVAIMSNDAEQYEDDSFENMRLMADLEQLPFPYLYDEDQSVAKAYDAVCTPDFFGFNKELSLQYRGRLDSSGMYDTPKAKRELFPAMVQISETGKGPEKQHPSIGCSIKWA